jgi:hypothetical protein
MKPWSEIEIPASKNAFNSILANPNHPFDFYWSKNITGQYVFRFMGQFDPDISDNAPYMRGIEVFGGVEGNRAYLTLVLESAEDAKIFHFLCVSLMEATEPVEPGNDPAAARVILNHLGRWQNLLKSRGSDLLTLQQQTGLFGELMVLRDIFMTNISAREAIATWTGPMGDEQDFGYGGNLVEVKTTRTTSDQEIKISALSQLDCISGKITMVFQTVAVFENQPPQSQSLNSLVSEILGKLVIEGGELAEQFEMRLAMVGYAVHPEYEKYHFAPVSRRIFAVEGDFPRICVGDLRHGVTKAAYSIMVDACLPFELATEDALARMLAGIENSSLDLIDVSPELLVKLDESATLEFKSTLRVCINSRKTEKFVEQSILKSVAALANSSGGQLVIGVNDEGAVLGLDLDYGSLPRQNRDGFEQYLSTMMLNAFGEAFAANNLSFVFHTVENRDICVIHVRRSSLLQFVEQVSASGIKSQKLYARIGNSSREIPPEKIQNFVSTRIM